MFHGLTIQVDKYKSFTDGLVIEDIAPVNIIIGKNNSGKSNIIDIVNYVFNESFVSEHHSELSLQVKVSFTNSFEELFEAFKNSRYGNGFNIQDYKRYSINCELISQNRSNRVSWGKRSIHNGDNLRIALENSVCDDKQRMISGCSCYHIQADRAIVPEARAQLMLGSSFLESVSPSGNGLTNLLRYILDSRSNAKRYKELLINGMNSILSPEIEIQDIDALSVKDDETFEIFIEESGKQSYPLSSLGSGIKTVLQLIMITEVIPEILSKERQYLIFAFEELENNLHPSAQRRLYRYIEKYAQDHGSLFFITTHSNIPLNYFFGKEVANIYHVIQKTGTSEVSLITGQHESRHILDDIGANPSDLLQSNGIVWVEGPSDRIYVKRWLELAGFDDCIEGYHYQFMYYGGRLLNHYSTEDIDSLINMLRVNRHSALLMDSDKKRDNSPINDTKKRIQKEFSANRLFIWCTKGKEIENYLLSEDIKKAFPELDNYSIGRYQPFKLFTNDDYEIIDFAKKITEFMTTDSLKTYDLEKQIKNLGNEIRKWNSS